MQKHNKICGTCGRKMRRNGRTGAGTERFRCMACGTSGTVHRTDTRLRHDRDRLVAWLTGPDGKDAVAKQYGLSRRALTKEFAPFFRGDPKRLPPSGYRPTILILDAKFIHGGELCALLSLDEHDDLFWDFATDECSGTWYGFLIRFKPPEVVVADGEKGVARFLARYWPGTAFQRCHFHMVKLAIQYLSRNPREEAGHDILNLMYRLKAVKTHEAKEKWILLFKIWEKQYAWYFKKKTDSGGYQYRKLRSIRNIVRRAIPNLFTYLDHPGCPNTTNLMEGWPNATIAEALRRHRGLHVSQKKILVSIVLSHLARAKPTQKFPPRKHT